MEQKETNTPETDTERRIREMAAADLRRAVEMMKVMNIAFGLISRVPSDEKTKPTVRTSER